MKNFSQSKYPIDTFVLDSFDDPKLANDGWNDLLRRGESNSIFLTSQWQRAWWTTYGQGKLMLVGAEKNGEIVALAPFFTTENMVYFNGASHDSYYLGFLGDVQQAGVLDALLQTARDTVANFQGFELDWLEDSNGITGQIQLAARRLGLVYYEKWELPSPKLDLTDNPESVKAAIGKKSLRRHENKLRREGVLQVRHFNSIDALEHLPAYFEQHIARWDNTATPSGFRSMERRLFYERICRLAAEAGWLRFTRLDWNDKPIAFHFGICYEDDFIWYQPSFAIDYAKRSPGEVLIRQTLRAAFEERARVFDLGPGEQSYKFRFASRVGRVVSCGLAAEI